MAINIDDLAKRKIEGGSLTPVIGLVQLVSSESGAVQDLLIDSEIGALAVIDAPHYEIHEGDTYIVSYKSPDASPVADNGTVIFALTIGATKEAHVVYTGACGGDFEIELWENANVTGGTATTPQNKNRGKPNAATVTVVRDPVVNSDGTTLLDNHLVPGGTGPQSTGSVSGERDEWVLTYSRVYMFRITNRAGAVQPMSLRVEWYEE